MTEVAHIREVGLRDGLQLVPAVLATERKLEWCRLEAAAGVAEFEVTSFVPARVMPQFADAEAVAAGALAIGGFLPSALVPNLRGAERGVAAGLQKLTYVVSASEAHSRANVGRNTDEALADFRRVIDHRNGGHPEVAIAAGIATAFGCTLAGEVPEPRVEEIAAELLEAGTDELVVADTVGYANPAQVRRLLGRIVALAGDVPVVAHFHDTRGLGLANVAAALETGVRRFDASIGGLGGCPFAPGATGNINTEDCAFLLESMGFSTGIDIDALVAVHRRVEAWLPGERLTGNIVRAGLPRTFRPSGA
jgi:hydroxymethylglutaryl-CoA lyase